MSDSSNRWGPFFTTGMIVAGLLSWTTHHSIPWAVIHSLFDWFYVIYWAFTYWK